MTRYILFLLFPFFLYTEEAPVVVLTVENTIQYVLTWNRDVLDVRDTLAKSYLSLENDEAFFSWKIAPNSVLGYSNYDKRSENQLSYGLGFSLSKNTQWGQRICISPAVYKKGKGFQVNSDVSFKQPLLKGAGKQYALARLHAANFSLRSTLRSTFTRQIGIVHAALQALYNLIKQRETTQLNKESVERLQKFYRISKAKEKIGLNSAIDLYRAELELKNTEEKLAQSNEQVRDVEERLKELLALPTEAYLEIDVALDYEIPSLELQEAIQTALDNRIEMDQALDAYNESRRLASLAKGNCRPQVDLDMTFSNMSSYDYFRGIQPDRQQNLWKVGIVTSKELYSVYDSNLYRLSRMAENQAQRMIEKTRDSIIHEVKRAYFALESSKKKWGLQKQQLKASEWGLKLSKMKFERALSDNFDVVEAEKNLRQGQVQLYSHGIDLILNHLKLNVALGLFAEKPRIPY